MSLCTSRKGEWSSIAVCQNLETKDTCSKALLWNISSLRCVTKNYSLQLKFQIKGYKDASHSFDSNQTRSISCVAHSEHTSWTELTAARCPAVNNTTEVEENNGRDTYIMREKYEEAKHQKACSLISHFNNAHTPYTLFKGFSIILPDKQQTTDSAACCAETHIHHLSISWSRLFLHFFPAYTIVFNLMCCSWQIFHISFIFQLYISDFLWSIFHTCSYGIRSWTLRQLGHVMPTLRYIKSAVTYSL